MTPDDERQPGPDHDESVDDPDEERWEERLALPVLVAALVSVPAVFLTLLDAEPWATVGTVVNWLAGAVLVGETVVLLLVTRDPVRWLREHVWLVALSVVTVVAVVFALGPFQLLRLVRVVGAVRLARVGRIVSAARKLQERTGMTGRGTTVLTVVAGLVVAAFVAVVLSDPTSRSRRLLEDVVGDGVPMTVLVVVAGLLLGVATFVGVRYRRRD